MSVRGTAARRVAAATTVAISLVTVVAVALGTAPTSAAPSGTEPPGAPGTDPGYASADKQGFGTAHSLSSPVWYTLGHGGATVEPEAGPDQARRGPSAWAS